jgi:hypothetical protein
MRTNYPQWYKGLLYKLIITQLVMKFNDFCGVLWFIALSIIIRYCTLSRVTWVQSAPSCVCSVPCERFDFILAAAVATCLFSSRFLT